MKTNIKTKINLYSKILSPSIQTDLGKAIARISLENLNNEYAIKAVNESLTKDINIIVSDIRTFDAIADLVVDDEMVTKMVWTERSDKLFTELKEISIFVIQRELNLSFKRVSYQLTFPKKHADGLSKYLFRITLISIILFQAT